MTGILGSQYLERQPLRLQERVWIYPPDWQHLEPTIGWVSTGAGLIVIDSGNSPEHGRRALRAIRSISDEPIRYLINTHRHWDHTFGNQVFAAPIIAHALCRRKLEQNLRDDWAPDRLMGWVQSFVLTHVPTLQLEQFAGLRLIRPEITFSGHLRLTLGATRLELVYLGGVHTRDSIGVYLPAQRLLFLGDALYFRTDQQIAERLGRLLRRIDALGAERFVAGHERPYDREVLARKARRWLAKSNSSG